MANGELLRLKCRAVGFSNIDITFVNTRFQLIDLSLITK